MNGVADTELFAAALVGYRAKLRAVDEKIQEIRSELSGSGEVAVVSSAATSKRTMSPEAREKVAEAQRKRWAAYHKEQEPTAPAANKAPAKKRKMSAAGRKAIAEATIKRWAAYRAQKAAPAKKAAPKRKLSPARKAALVANLAKARAARAAKRSAGDAVPF